MNEIIAPHIREVVIDDKGRQTNNLSRFLMLVANYIRLLNNDGFTGTITTAPLTGLGAPGSMTFQNGVLISQVPAT